MMKEDLLLLKDLLEPQKIKFENIYKKVRIDKVERIVNKCNNGYHRIIKMKPN